MISDRKTEVPDHLKNMVTANLVTLQFQYYLFGGATLSALYNFIKDRATGQENLPSAPDTQ